MSQVLERETSGTPVSPARPVSRRRTIPILLQIGAMIGIAALVYPSAADWFSTLAHNSEVSGYTQAVENLPSAEREAKLQVARDYNAHMPQGVLRDPYSATTEQNEQDAAYQSYLDVLRVSDSGVIGELNYPRLDIGLPVYHGTSDDVISKGVGHLYGSSLPVGGPSTHTVLTSHSGLVHSTLFTELTNARINDTFEVTVLGETHHYKVDHIETVLPDETDSLSIVDGKDYVTLITCTPIGINSHRLLVRGVRTADPAFNGDTSAIAGDGHNAGFPWWALIFVAGSAVTAAVLFTPARSGRSTRQHHKRPETLS